MKYSLGLINCLAAAVLTGIWLASRFDLPALALIFPALLIAVLAVRAVYRRHFSAGILLVLLFLCLGAIRFTHENTLPAYAVSHYAGQTVTVYGTICETPRTYVLNEKQMGVRYVVDVNGIALAGGRKLPGAGKIMVSSRQDRHSKTGWPGGECIVKGRVENLHGFHNPGLIDTVAALRRAGVIARMNAGFDGVKLTGEGAYRWQGALHLMREKALLTLQKVMPESEAAMLFGILFGGYAGIEPEVVEAFSATGIVHILSVSGTHIALVAGAVYWLCTLFNVGGKRAALLVTAVIAAYGAFAGLTPPVVRSAVMGITAVGAIALGRERDAGHALAITALAMVIIQPSLIFDISFQLSFGSTAGLIYLYPKLKTRLNFLPALPAAAVSLTLAAQLGVLPFVAWYFNAFSLSAFVANFIVVPLVEVVVVLGLAGLAVNAVLPVAGDLALLICSFLIGIVITLTKGLAAIPGGTVYLPPFDIFAGLVYYIFLGWLFGYTPLRIPSLLQAAQCWPRQSLAIVLVLGLSFMVYQSRPQPLNVHFIDVAQGDATLVVTPQGRAVLIDTGGASSQSALDIGKRVVVPYLRHYGIERLDYLILTHGHQDHAGGAAAVAGKIPISHILVARERYSPAVDQLALALKGQRFIPAYTGQKIWLDSVLLEVVHAVDSKAARFDNEASNVIRISYGKHSFLITGDLERPGEEAVLAAGTPIASTVLKVGHHGAKTSTSPAFLQLVAPEYAVISAGAGNRFGHPHPEILQRLSARRIKTYRTDQQGAVVFQTDGKKLSVSSFLP
ncbi:DNA internalization-related competence protein ComEC/Rec2|uniref:Competence protein ComEC n=1 Tax=Dendrosporobacter quercicolus TaxID=146817 RepID=A0A1G9MUB2_9FIRM|nr:DNA internalization-related competence protein ComEC/Rec2 [Dendrosporobacter quercicolus]NSL47142.1 DNA internalization-related competence protein ComEC/Rec2 [Dendrosporobacter quercicolus DSM 1736]SDL77830.1 competence protein ComEC [Dendrosporobacter quercicolus]